MQRHIPIHKCVKVYFSCSEKYNFPIISERKKARREYDQYDLSRICMYVKSICEISFYRIRRICDSIEETSLYFLDVKGGF